MTLNEYFGGWVKVIDLNTLNKILSILNKLYSTTLICPNKKDIFRAFELCKYEDCKAVFLGMDPYAQKGVATGILFGNNKEVTEDKLSPSLKVVKEACINYEIPHNSIIFDQTLESWAKQGILMINSALTVEMNKTGSHVMLWRPFISGLLKNLSNNNTGLIYVLFGSQAKTFKPYINDKFNHIIEVEHPAYFARTNTRMSNEVFININKLIKDTYGVSIEWYKEY